MCLRLLFIFLALGPGLARAQEAAPENPGQPTAQTQSTVWAAYILRRKDSASAITDLKVPLRKIPVVLFNKDGRLRPLIEIKGIYDRPGWTLFAQTVQLKAAAGPAEFKTYAYLNAKINDVALTAHGPNGELENETLYIYAPDAQEFEVVSSWDRVVVALGPSILSFSQSGYGNITALTGEASAQYASPPDRPSRWGLFASGDFTTLLFLASRPIDTSPDILQLKLDALYRLTAEKPSHWQVQFIGGVNYLTMFSNGSPFGFSNLINPDIGLRTRYLLNSQAALIGDFHWEPFGVLSQRGFDISFGLSRTLRNFHRFEFGLNFSDYRYFSDRQTEINYDLFTLKFGYSI